MNSAKNNSWQKPIKVSAIPPYRLRVMLENQQELELDLMPLVTQREVFWRLRNFRYFKKVGIDPLGGLCWPEGEDIAPERIAYYKT